MLCVVYNLPFLHSQGPERFHIRTIVSLILDKGGIIVCGTNLHNLIKLNKAVGQILADMYFSFTL